MIELKISKRAEYWKSLPRKFCEICKCWFADNKASIDFHERGKRHQENAQKQIKDIRKRSAKEYKKQKELEDDMEKIEKAALAAYKKDLQNMQGGDTSGVDLLIKSEPAMPTPEIRTKPKNPVKNVQKKNPVKNFQKDIVKKEVEEPPAIVEPPVLEKLWYEAETEEGHKYYWNAETSESQWEPPEEGYVSVEEQNRVIAESEELQQKSPEDSIENDSEESTESSSAEEDKEDIPCAVGPQPKYDPYGQWVTVEKKEPVQYDLQLPKPSEDYVEVVIPIHKDEPSLKFKEKVIGTISDGNSGDVTFKKRKFAGSFKRNARQRTADDD